MYWKLTEIVNSDLSDADNRANGIEEKVPFLHYEGNRAVDTNTMTQDTMQSGYSKYYDGEVDVVPCTKSYLESTFGKLSSAKHSMAFQMPDFLKDNALSCEICMRTETILNRVFVCLRCKADNQQCGSEDINSLKQIRVELEKLRLLCERSIKREKLKVTIFC
ncbi:hypothetical protein B296_00030816 [Ensete ventricosum]|uniref:Uncharacterized protein n=1 Tax=Ensete ventricosum TaxID=4639 RepID=A0A427AI54_ENSVE|nr:hypothetical protein B296_00030816 [Ensete ventricosum]